MQALPIGARRMPNPADRPFGVVGMCVGRRSGTQTGSAVGYKNTTPVVEHEPALIDCRMKSDRPNFAAPP
jgi:hypothetical protein